MSDTTKDAVLLKPCPMCNASLSEATASGYHHHPANGCIFSGFELSRDDVAAWNRRAPAEVQDEAVQVDGAVTLTGAQLLEAFQFVAPDHPKDPDQLECEVTIQRGDGYDGRGLYCWITEYPEEGAIRLDTAHAASGGERS
ncbi:hypothetical protein [Paraburkholderia xenovorans]